MIVFTRTSSIAAGKLGEALAFARDVAGYISKHFGVEVKVHMPIGGNPNRISWSGHFESLAGFDAMMAQQAGDEGYAKLLKRAGDLFISGSTRDQLWREV